jgi:maltose O-acetyltransferase
MPDDRFVPDGRSNHERMLAGDQYIADDPDLAHKSDRTAILTARFNNAAADDHAGRLTTFKELLGGVGEGAAVRPPFRCDYGDRTRIGARSFANWGLIALDIGAITIGDDVQIGPNVQLLTATHPTEPGPRRAKWEGSAPITIGDNVWLGGGVIVCPGVTIGKDTVVGAGAVVVRDLPAGVVAAGNPARVVRSLRARSREQPHHRGAGLPRPAPDRSSIGPGLSFPTMAWITKNSAGTRIERRDEPYLTAHMRDELVNIHLPRYEVRKGALFPALHMIQHHYGWIPHQAMLEIAEVLQITPAEVFDTVSFYEEYWTKPKGEVLISVCRSIACEFCDATRCTEAIKARLGIDVGETTPDNKFTLVELECIGSCGTAPAALYNEDLHENLTPARCVELIDQIQSGSYQHGGSGAVKDA